MTKETNQSDILRILTDTYPEIRRSSWRHCAIEAFADLEGGDNIREAIQAVRYEPDAFVIDKKARELLFFEVEVYSVLKKPKLQTYAAFSMELAGYVTFALLTVNKHGHINTIDLLPHYADWLKENAP